MREIENYTSRLCALVLAIAAAAAPIAVQAQRPDPAPRLEMAQSLTDAQEQQLKQKAARAIDLLNEKDYAGARALAAPKLQEALSLEYLALVWERLIEMTGPLKKQVASRVIDGVNADLVVVTAEFAEGTENFIVTFNSEGQIIGVDFPKVETIDEIAAVVINALAANDFPRARGYLHPFLKTEIFPQQVREQWQQVIRENGAFRRIVDLDVRNSFGADDLDVVIATVEFQKGSQPMFLLFDDSRRLVGVDMAEAN